MKIQSEESEQPLAPALFLTNFGQPTVFPQKRRNSFQTAYGNIETWFEENARLLSQRKQRAKQHHRRMQLLENQFQKKKIELQRSLQQKIEQSSKIKSKTIERIQQRLHKNSERHDKISSKTKIQHQQQIRKHLEIRKSFQPEDYQFNSKFSRKSKSSSTAQRVQIRLQKARKIGNDVDRILEQYKEKQQHAKDVSEEIKRQAAERARSHNSIEVSDVKHRALFRKENELRLQSHEIITRIDQLNLVRKKKEKLVHQKHEKKNKSLSQKINRIKNNLQQIEQQRNTKYDELTEKFEKKVQRKSWRDRKTSINSRRLFENLLAIESQQIAKADKIIEKHRQIGQKYKFYKQKKEQLYKNYKNPNE